MTSAYAIPLEVVCMYMYKSIPQWGALCCLHLMPTLLHPSGIRCSKSCCSRRDMCCCDVTCLVVHVCVRVYTFFSGHPPCILLHVSPTCPPPPHFAALLTDVHVCACCSAWLYDDTVTIARLSDRCAALTNLTLDSVEALQVDRSRTSRRTHVTSYMRHVTRC